MKAHNTSIAELEPGDFLTGEDYQIFKGILASQQVFDLQQLSVVLQKDLRYLSEIFDKLDLSLFNIKKQVQNPDRKHRYRSLWYVLGAVSVILGCLLIAWSVNLFIVAIQTQTQTDVYTFVYYQFTGFALIIATYYLFNRKGMKGAIPQKPVTQYMTAFKSRAEIDSFIAKIRVLEDRKKNEVQLQQPVQKRYYLVYQVAALIGLVAGISLIGWGLWSGINQLIAHLPPANLLYALVGGICIIIPAMYKSYFRGDGLWQIARNLEKHFHECIPAYNSLLNILMSGGNVVPLKDLDVRPFKVSMKETLATFSSEGRRKLQWWRQRRYVGNMIATYDAQFPPEIIHYIPSIGVLVRPIKGDAPAQLEDWQMNLFRGIMYLDRRVDISYFLKLAAIPRRNFLGALYKIIASGTIEVDLKGDSIEFRDENQVNQMISQLQQEFQAWKV